MSKKRLVNTLAGVVVFVFSVLLTRVVSAATFGAYQAQSFIQNTFDSINAILTPILTATFGQYSGYDFLFAKFLVFILLFVVVRTAVKSIPKLGKQNGVTLIVALVVSILSMRFISDNAFFNGILLPYGVLGVALTTIIPFVIYFFFVHKSFDSSAARKAATLFFFVIMLIIWWNKKDQLDDVSNYIYIGILILSVLLLIFDRTIRKYYGFTRENKYLMGVYTDRIIDLKEKHGKALKAGEERRADEIEEQIKDLQDKRNAL